jgi:hypothetical protein
MWFNLACFYCLISVFGNFFMYVEFMWCFFFVWVSLLMVVWIWG